jgi:hypothetical protein
MGTTDITDIMVITTDTDTTRTWSRSQVPKSCQKKMKKKRKSDQQRKAMHSVLFVCASL